MFKLIKIIIFFFSLILMIHCNSNKKTSIDQAKVLTPKNYQKALRVGMDVDWAKTNKGIQTYSIQMQEDLKAIGFSHIRIRVAKELTPDLITHLNKIIDDALSVGLIPILAYQGKEFKENPNSINRDKVIKWWKIAAESFKNKSNKLSFDLLIEVTDKLNKQPEQLNDLYHRVLKSIRQTNSNRIVFFSPRLRSSPDYLHELNIPEDDHFIMAEWHMYAAGPQKNNPKKLWTTGTEYEKKLIRKKIETALKWQKKTGIYTWVGAWMPGNYNKGNNYSIKDQIHFANFMACELQKAQIPYAVNSDTKFYDRDKLQWKKEMLPVIKAIIFPNCK